MSELVLVEERHGAVLVGRLNRPDARNALSPELIRSIATMVVAAENDPDIRAVVLTGAGDRAFCSGMDLRAFADGESFDVGGDDSSAFMRLLEGRVGIPVIGAANGSAVAGGLELLLACDVIVAADHARFGLPEVQRGLLPGGGGTLLGRRIPLNVALEINLTGELISASRAYEIGLVNAVVAAEDVLTRALDIAQRIAQNGPLAVRAIKELVRLAATGDVSQWAHRLAELQPAVFASDDAAEGARAFVEKRTPQWSGR